jgi:hypothetical protein
VEWHRDLMIVNPTISGRFCNSCVEVEASYHGLSIEEMHECRARLRLKRISQSPHHKLAVAVLPAANLPTSTAPQTPSQDRSLSFEQEISRARGERESFYPERMSPRVLSAGDLPDRVFLVEKSKSQDTNEQSSPPCLERGEACWCHRAKNCDGNHKFHNVAVHNVSALSK